RPGVRPRCEDLAAGSLHLDQAAHGTTMVFVYIGFILFIVALLALDLGVFHRKAHVIGVREALGWSAFWISLGLAFSGVVYVDYEQHWFGLGTGFDAMDAPVEGPDGTLIYNDG